MSRVYDSFVLPDIIRHMENSHNNTLAVIGQGYVGLPLAITAVNAGWNVLGVDIFESKVAQINSGSSPVEDISDDQLQLAIKSGSYEATTTSLKFLKPRSSLYVSLPHLMKNENQILRHYEVQQLHLRHFFQIKL